MGGVLVVFPCRSGNARLLMSSGGGRDKYIDIPFHFICYVNIAQSPHWHYRGDGRSL